jgi:hypothetical protein
VLGECQHWQRHRRNLADAVHLQSGRLLDLLRNDGSDDVHRVS